MEIDWGKMFAKEYLRTVSTIRAVDHCFVNPCSELILTQKTQRPSHLERWFNKEINSNKYEGGNKMFNVNDEIVVVKNEYEQFIGKEGVILEVTKSNDGRVTYGVDFKDLTVGHDLDGKCAFGHGWYVLEDEIELLHQSKLCRMVEKSEGIMKAIKSGSEIQASKGNYTIRKNGALTFLTQEGRKVFVYKDGATSPLILNCISEDDRIVTLHLMEAFRILPMYTIQFGLISGIPGILTFTQEESDKLEAEMFPVEVPVVEVSEPLVEATSTAKVYHSEEELYAEMGITKK